MSRVDLYIYILYCLSRALFYTLSVNIIIILFIYYELEIVVRQAIGFCEVAYFIIHLYIEQARGER